MGAIPNSPLPAAPAPDSPSGKFLQQFPNLIFGAIAAVILAVIVWGLSPKEGGFLNSLSDGAIARGLITFLITFTTVGIAIILAVSTIVSSSGDDADKRFDKGKQVLSVLIGLLGTIVGFYFGSSTDIKAASANRAAQGIVIAPANISNSQPKKGEKFTISSFISGGKTPYLYSITFDPQLIPAVKDAQAPGGLIRQEFAVPDSLAADTQVRFQISVTDSDKKAADYNKDGSLRLSLKAK
jgi:hypothetical protein